MLVAHKRTDLAVYEFKRVFHEYDGPVGCPLAWCWLAWRGWRTSLNRPTKWASLASCWAMTVELWKRRSVLKSWVFLSWANRCECFGECIILKGKIPFPRNDNHNYKSGLWNAIVGASARPRKLFFVGIHLFINNELFGALFTGSCTDIRRDPL